MYYFDCKTEPFMEFRPCIDLHNGKVKQIVGSSLSDGVGEVIENFSTDKLPSEFVKLYKKDKLRGGHIIKLGDGNDEAAKEALAQWENSFHIGGAINDENAKYWLDCGASHVIVTSFVFKDGKINLFNLQKLKKAVKKERIVLDLSCKKRENKYYVVTDRWQKFTDEIICEKTLDFLADYCDEFLIHAADIEGKKQGADLELVEILAENVKIPTTYDGGIST
jgi:phosphoribosylformimino-5-aminoimidazole carboxamide ribotide isomerase